MLRHAAVLLAFSLATAPFVATATSPPSPNGWNRTDSFESLLRSYQTRHFITTGDYFAFSQDPNKPPPGNFPEDGYYGDLLSTYALDEDPASPFPSMIDGMYAGLFQEGGDQYWTKSISHRFVTPQAFESLMAGELTPGMIYSRTVGEADPPPRDGYLAARNTVSFETKIDMIAERLGRLRYYLKPLPAAEVFLKSSGRITSNAYRFTAQAAIDAALSRWNNATETPEGGLPSPYLRTYESKENVLYANSIGRYYADIKSYRIRYEVDLTGLQGTAYAFQSINVAPGSGSPPGPGDMPDYAARFGGTIPDGHYHHFATRPAGGLVSFPWVSTGIPFSGSDEPRNMEFRVSTEGSHRENYPDGNNAYGPFTIVDLGADPAQVPGDVSCDICTTGTCIPGTSEFANNSVDATFSLGSTTHGTTQGQLCLKLQKPLPDAYHPSMLEIRGGRAFGSLADASTGELAQFYGPETIVEITDLSPLGYTLVFHQRDSGWRTSETTGLYEHPGTSPQIAAIRVENPDASGNTYASLNITRTDGAETTVTEYVHDPATGAWSMASDNGELTDALTITGDPGARTESRQILDSQGNVIGESATSTGSFGWGSEVVESSIGNGSSAVTTRYSYYADNSQHGTAYGKICQRVMSDGSWTRYHYEPLLGRLAYEIRGLGDLPPPPDSAPNDPTDHGDTIDESRCQVRRYIHPWDPDAAAPHTLTTIDSVNGVEVARHYTTRTWGQTVEQKCLTAGAAYDPAKNLTTTTTFYLESEYTGLPRTVTRPDGTRSIFTYGEDGSGNRVKTVKTGVPNELGTDIVDGTTTITTTNPQGNVIRTRVTDMKSALVIQDDQAVADAIDSFGRPTVTTHLGGLQSSVEFDCCGISASTDRFGATTTYAEDVPLAFTSPLTSTPHILQAATQTTAAAGGEITTATARDGRLEYSLRIGTDGSVMVRSITETDTAGRVVRRIAPVGNASGFAETTISETFAETGNRIVTTTGPDGATSIATYYLDGRLKSLTGSATQPHRFEYGVAAPGLQYTKQVFLNTDLSDSQQWVRTTTGMLGETVKVERSSGFAPGGVSTESYHYDDIGRLIAQTDADGVTVMYAYDALGRRDTVALDRNGNRLIDYDGTDRIAETKREYAHLIAGDATSPVVARTTNLAWEAEGANAPVPTSLQARAISGLDTWTTTRGRTTQKTLSYDGTSWSEITLRPDRSHIVRTFAADTGLTALESETLYDASQQAVTSTANAYDSHGRLSATTDDRHGGITTTYTYFDSDQLAAKTLPPPGTGQHAAQTTSYTYDHRGNRDIVTLPTGQTVDYDHSPTGELIQVQGAHTYHVTYEYDHRGRTRKMHTRPGTPQEATTEWAYHPSSGLLAKKIAPGGNTISYTYTPAGRLAARINGRGTTIAHSYLTSGELSAVTYDDDVTHNVAFTYQRSGALASRSDAAGLQRYRPETQGAYAGHEISGGALDQTSITPGYDQLGRRTTLTLTAGSVSLTNHFTYDQVSRLESVTHENRRATHIFRPGHLLPQGVEVADGGSTALTRTQMADNLGRITTTSASIGSTPPTPISQVAYVYNNSNQRTTATLADGSRWTYHYDAYSHLTDATKYLADPGSESYRGFAFDYTYDGLGNRLATSTSGLGSPGQGMTTSSKTQQTPAAGDNSQSATIDTPGVVSVAGEAPPGATVTVALPSAAPATAARQGNYFHHIVQVDNSDGPQRLETTITATLGGSSESVTRTKTVPAATTTLTYDADGNLTGDGTRTLSWDAENRLLTVETIPAATPPGALEYRVEFTYDATGRRVQKQVSHRINGQWAISSNRRFLYDGWNLLAELEGSKASPKLLRSYTWGTDLSGAEQNAGGIAGLLLVNIHSGPGAGTHAPTYDANGNILALVDTGTLEVSASYDYDPFGNLLQATGPAAKANPFRFSTKYHDDTTALIYYGLRYYNPGTGRWISRDPIGEDGGTNLYSFVGNDPINQTDVLGLVLFAFDGTGNDRDQDSWDAEGKEKTPTNVAIMTDLYDGQAFYVHGVGTRTEIIFGNLNGKGTKKRLITQLKRFCIYNKEHPTEPIDIIGFSRGAASARIFSNMIRRATPNPNIRFLGIFDTVSQIGLPNRFNFQFGYSLDVSSRIGLISHAVAKNEYRSLFPLTSISKSAYLQYNPTAAAFGQLGLNAFDPEEFREIRGSNFIEKPFVGAHSDIGGGYSNGRNINALRWMIHQGQSIGAPFKNLDEYQFASKIRQISKPDDSRYIIDLLQGDRVIFEGNL